MKSIHSFFMGVLIYYATKGLGLESDTPLFWLIVLCLNVISVFFRVKDGLK